MILQHSFGLTTNQLTSSSALELEAPDTLSVDLELFLSECDCHSVIVRVHTIGKLLNWPFIILHIMAALIW